MVEAIEEVVGEQPCERLGEPGVGDAVDVDVDGFEDRLVEMPAGRFVGSGVGGAEVSGEPERGLEVAFDGLPVDFCCGESGSGISDLFGEAGLVLLEEVEIDSTGGVGLQKLAAFGFEVGDALAGAEALAAGLDSPTLRILAGASRRSADEDASEHAPQVFAELGLDVEQRLSPAAIIEGARQDAAAFVAVGGSPRELARRLYGAYVASGYANELADWSGFDDWYDMIEGEVISGSLTDVDAAVRSAAQDLIDGRVSAHVNVSDLFLSGKKQTLWERTRSRLRERCVRLRQRS